MINITSHDNKVTLLASGSEVSIALEVQNNLKNVESSQKLFQCHVMNYLMNKMISIKKKL